MGGHLSCISCKNEKENIGDNKPKKKKREEEVPASHVTTSSVKYNPVTSGLELYQILRSNNGFAQKGDGNLSDVEKVARAIVELNVYLASQVIYPAIQIYLQESQLNRAEDIKAEMQEKKEKQERPTVFSS